MNKAKVIIDSLKFVKDISVGKCLWGSQWEGEYKGQPIMMDAIHTYVASEFTDLFTVYPDKFAWITDHPHFDGNKYLPEVSDEQKMNCTISVITFWQYADKIQSKKN